MSHMTTFEERGNALPRFLVQGYLDASELDEAIEMMIAFRDKMDGDPDLEDDDPAEQDDHPETAWVEWTEMAPSLRGVRNVCGGYDEGDEHCGDEQDGTFAEDENAARFKWMTKGPGCTVADPDEGVDDNGEETSSEDSFWLPHYARANTNGPGCTVSDNDGNYGE